MTSANQDKKGYVLALRDESQDTDESGFLNEAKVVKEGNYTFISEKGMDIFRCFAITWSTDTYSSIELRKVASQQCQQHRVNLLTLTMIAP